MTTQNTSPTPKHSYTPQFQLPEAFPLEGPIRRFKQLPDSEKERILRDFRYTKEWERHCWGETFGAAQRYLADMFGKSLCRKISVEYRYDDDGQMFLKASFKSKNDRDVKNLFNVVRLNADPIIKYASYCKRIKFSVSATPNFSDVDDTIDWARSIDEFPIENDVSSYQEFENILLGFLADVFQDCVGEMTYVWEKAHREENYLDFIHGKIWHLDKDGNVILDFYER